jgi:hypothetical protein
MSLVPFVLLEALNKYQLRGEVPGKIIQISSTSFSKRSVTNGKIIAATQQN